MSQQVSLPALLAMFAQETEEIFLTRITLDHPNLRHPIKVVNDTIPLIVGSSVAADSTDNELDGTVVGASWVRGLDLFGAGLQFSSGAHQVTLPQINLGNEWTIEVQHKPDNLDPNSESVAALASFGLPYLALGDGGRARISWRDSGGTQRDLLSAPGLVEADKKYHFSARHKGTTTELLIDGEVVATDNTHDSEAINSTARLGRLGAAETYNYSGIISDARFWSVARSVNQLADSYRDPLFGDETGLAAWYQLNDGAFLPYPFNVRLPNDTADQLPRVTLAIDNVDTRISEQVRKMDDPPTVTLEVVMASSPTTIEAGPFAMTLKNVRFDETTIEGELSYEDILNDRYPKDLMTPTTTPGLF